MDPITITILVVILIAATVALIMLSGSKNGRAGRRDAARPGEFQAPSNSEDRSLPVVIGTRRVSPGVISWWGLYRRPIVKVEEIETGGKDGGTETIHQVVGHAVFTRQLMGLCEGPADDVVEFFLDDELVWSGSAGPGATFAAQTGHPNDGDGSSHTGPSNIIHYSGIQTSTPEYAAASGDDVPYHRTSALFMNGVFVGDNVTRNSNWAITVRARDALFTHNLETNLDDGTKRRIGDYDVNPADIAFYVLRWMLQVPEDEVDIESFRTAQTKFYDEGTGLSVLIESLTSADDILADIERHTDSHIFVSGVTGLWTMRAVRDDYDLEQIPVLTNSDVGELTIVRQGINDTFTDMKVSFTDRRTHEPLPFRIVNDANRRSVAGARSDTIDLEWFTDPDAFWLAVARLKRRNFVALSFPRFSVARTIKHSVTGLPWNPEPGDVFMLNYTDPEDNGLTINGLIGRVMVVEGNQDDPSSLLIEAVQDIWSTSGVTITTNPGGDETFPDLTIDEELGALAIGDAIPELTRIPSIVVLGGEAPNDEVDRYRVSVNGRAKGSFPVIPHASLDGELAAGSTLFDRSGSFTIDGCSPGVAAWTQSEGAWQRLGRFVIVRDTGGAIEIIGVKTLTDNENGTFTATGLIRALAGTANAVHADDSAVWLPSNEIAGFFDFAAAGPKIPVAGESLNNPLSVVVTPENIRFSGPTTTQPYTYQRGIETPYPVADLTVVADGLDAVLTWSPRNRHSGWAATNASIDATPAYDAVCEADHFEITDDDESDPILAPSDPPTYRVVGGNVGGREYTVRTGVKGYYSSGVSATL